MDSFFKFAGEHPILTVILAIIFSSMVVRVLKSPKIHHHHYKDGDE